MQGKNINGFILQRLLGTGGMAEVWYAENEIGMKAAVKIMSEKLSHDEQMQERFLNEARVMVRLDHPNIRKVYGYGSIDNRPAIIMEYLDGSDLKARMKRGLHFSQEELKRWWNQIVDALNYTHSQDIVHRDIKPSNIFVDQKGNAKLLDFGIAKVADTSSGTLTGSTLGTRIYMSPEQVKDPKRVGTASDLYSLAVSFVHLLTGKAPYDSTTSSDYDIQESIVRKPLDLSKVPTEWRSFLEPYLSKNPADRPALRAYGVVSGASQNSVPDDYDDDSTAADAPPLSTDEDTFAEVSKSDAPQIKYGDETPSIPDNIIKPHTTRKKIVFLSILIPVIALLLVGVGTISYSYYWNHYNLGHLQRKEKDLQEQLDKKREELETLDPNKDHPAFIKYYEQCKKECDEIEEDLRNVQDRLARIGVAYNKVKRDITVCINDHYQFFVDNSPTDEAQLMDVINTRIGNESQAEVILRSDNSVPIQLIVNVFDAVFKINNSTGNKHKLILTDGDLKWEFLTSLGESRTLAKWSITVYIDEQYQYYVDDIITDETHLVDVINTRISNDSQGTVVIRLHDKSVPMQFIMNVIDAVDKINDTTGNNNDIILVGSSSSTSAKPDVEVVLYCYKSNSDIKLPVKAEGSRINNKTKPLHKTN